MCFGWLKKAFTRNTNTLVINPTLTASQMLEKIRTMQPGETRTFYCDPNDYWFATVDGFTLCRAEWTAYSGIFVHSVYEVTDKDGRVVQVTLTKSSYM